MNLQNLIWGLEELADRDLQERLWTGNIVGEMSSFTEAVSSVFDSSGLGFILTSGKTDSSVSSEFKNKAKSLDRLIRLVPQSASPQDIIQDATMSDVRAVAQDLLILAQNLERSE